MKRYRDQGYSIPYNISKVETFKFKGAFTSIDGEILPGEIAIQPDIASEYPSAIQLLSCSHESLRFYPTEGAK
jgi:hypothetical protein